MPVFEAVGPAQSASIRWPAWGPDEIAAHMDEHGLRQKPLGRLWLPVHTVNFFPCTTEPGPGRIPDLRSGRWSGQAKTECGIHLPGALGETQAKIPVSQDLTQGFPAS